MWSDGYVVMEGTRGINPQSVPYVHTIGSYLGTGTHGNNEPCMYMYVIIIGKVVVVVATRGRHRENTGTTLAYANILQDIGNW